MNQEIIVYIILVVALAYIIYSIMNKPRIKKSNNCSDCKGCTAKCEIKSAIVKKSLST